MHKQYGNSKCYCNIKNELTKDTLIEHLESINYQMDSWRKAQIVPGGIMLVSFSVIKIKRGKTGWKWLEK